MRKFPAFNPVIIIKGILILFIAVGLGMLYLFYRTGVSAIAAWVAVSLITILIGWLYAVFFTDINVLPGKTQDMSRMDHITYHQGGFDIVSPLLQQKMAIAWLGIESILYDDQPYHDYDSYHERYTFILKNEPVIQLNADASWLNRIFVASKTGLKLYIDDERNADFHSLKQAIDQNLKVSTRYDDSKRGKLIRETIDTDKSKRVVTQQWEPGQTDYPLQLIYDAYNRSIADVLLQHGMLSA